MEQEDMWLAVATRDVSKRSAFIIGVKTTGIFCRPGCPARTPKRINVEFFPTAHAARQAGYRACKKCDPDEESWLLYEAELSLLSKVSDKISRNLADGDKASVETISVQLGVSAEEIKRLFKKYLGLSARAFIEARKMGRFRQSLMDGSLVTDAIYDAGFEGPRRVYELASSHLGMTPKRFASKGAGERIHYALVACSMGRLLVAATEKGVCRIMMGDDDESLEKQLHAEFANADLSRGHLEMARHVARVLAYLDLGKSLVDLPLDVQATAFEAKVWQGLRDIPFGETLTYGELASEIGAPKAARAVGRACGANPVALAVPCHRAVGQGGKLTGFAWGLERKQILLEKEKKES